MNWIKDHWKKVLEIMGMITAASGIAISVAGYVYNTAAEKTAKKDALDAVNTRVGNVEGRVLKVETKQQEDAKVLYRIDGAVQDIKDFYGIPKRNK
jgi:hypothetical protein